MSAPQMPGAERAVINKFDVTGFLLAGTKAAQWALLGYDAEPEDGALLQQALELGARGHHEVLAGDVHAGYPQDWEIRFELNGRNGKSGRVRTYWTIERRGVAPRLYSACLDRSEGPS